MAGRELPFIFYLVDTPTGLAYYRDPAGNVQETSVTAAIDLNLRNAPDGWMNTELGFSRNQRYGFGLNRSFSLPHKLVNDAAYITRYLMNRGRGIEVPLTMLVYKYDGNPAPGDPTYGIYYRGQVDLPASSDILGEGIQANLMEGGFMKILKNLESTMFEIPCDGSIPENIKVNMDGMLFQDVFNYSIIPMTVLDKGVSTLGCVFVNNEGDNAGIVHNDPTFQPLVSAPSNYYQVSPNYLMNSALKITVEIEGNIVISPADNSKPIGFNMFLATNQTVPISGTNHETRTLNLVPEGGLVGGTGVYVPQQINLPFSGTFTIDGNEALFVQFNSLLGFAGDLKIIGGSFRVKLASQFPVTTPWVITLYDLGKLLIKNMCTVASVNGQTYNYDFESQLLQDNLNLVATSGDALRASGDSNYQRFYNAVQNNPNFPNVNLFYSYGPVIKTSWQDYFDSVNAILNASTSTRQRTGFRETVFIEKKGFVFDATVTNLDNGEVSKAQIAPALDLYFTLFKVGYNPQQYDQKAGKYAWNTTAEWIAPITSIPSKALEVISKYLTDPYLIEKLRSGVDDTSSTRNNSDNSVFVINTDPTSSVFDKYTGSFTSGVVFPSNPGQSGNTNLLLKIKQYFQSIAMPVINGSYLSFSSNPAIFIFNQPALASGSFTLGVNITGNLLGSPASSLTGLPADTVTLKLWINGAVFQTWTTTSSSPSTPINITLSVSHAFSFKDTIYFTCDTSASATAELDSVALNLSDGSSYLAATGSAIEVEPGIIKQLLTLPAIAVRNDGNGNPVMSYGFQFFDFNSVLINSNFDLSYSVNGLITGGTPGQLAEIDLFVNGVPVSTQTIVRTSGVQPFAVSLGTFTVNRDFQVGDIIFLVGSAQNIAVYFTNALLQLTSTQIKAYLLKRVQYDFISGIPTLLGNIPGTATPITTGPGAPYNIERLTPKRMLETWGNYLRSILFDQIPGKLAFSTLSKNQYLSTTYQGKTYTENADVLISDLEKQLFKARYITYSTRVQETFATIMSGAANAYANASFYGVALPGFPVDMKQKPALNEMQDWKLLAGPDLDLNTLNGLNIDGLKYLDMKPNSIFCSFLSPIQFVPEGQVLPAKYHTRSRNLYWYNEQVVNWINQNNYWNPWQKGDAPPLQFITRDLNQVQLKLYACSGNEIATTNAVLKSSPAVIAPYFLWEVPTDFSALAEAGHYMRAIGGSGANTAVLISEGLNIKTDWPETMLFEYTHSENKQSMIFDTGYSPSLRVRGFFDNTFKQKYKGAFYIDQPQNIEILNAIPYETADLTVGLDDGIPDYVHKKVARILLLNGTKIEGEGFSLDENAEWEETFIQGNPKKYQKIAIRPSNNLDGIYASVDGFTEDTTMMVSLDAQFFGPNAGNAGSTEPNIVTVEIS